MSIKVSRKNVIPYIKRLVFRSEMVLYNANKPLLIVGFGFIGLSVVSALFIPFIDSNQIQVGFVK